MIRDCITGLTFNSLIMVPTFCRKLFTYTPVNLGLLILCLNATIKPKNIFLRLGGFLKLREGFFGEEGGEGKISRVRKESLSKSHVISTDKKNNNTNAENK